MPVGPLLGFVNAVFKKIEQRAARDRRAATLRASLRMPAGLVDDVVAFAAASDATADLVHDGKLDEAEHAARDLIERFPDMHDGWDRLGMVYEARGDNQKAADCYRKVIDLVRTYPGGYDDAFEDVFVKLVDKLDPPHGKCKR